MEQKTDYQTRRLTQEIIDALAVPFAAAQVQWKPQSLTRDKSRALAVAYVDARDVAERLDQATHGDWEFDFELLTNGKVKGRLTVCGCTRCDMGDCDQDNAKGDVSDALKRCAVLFGVSRYLYRLPTTWVAYDAQTKKLKTKPRLPAWALPGATTNAAGKGDRGAEVFAAGEDDLPARTKPETEPPAGNGTRPAPMPKNAKAAVVRTARWEGAIKDVCAQTGAHYLDKHSKPNGSHLVAAAGKEGFSEITSANIEEVVKRLVGRVADGIRMS